MTKQKHFYLIRGLVREKGHWGSFSDEVQKIHPDAKISYIDIPGNGIHFQSVSPLTVSGMVEKMRQEFLNLRAENDEAHMVAISLGAMVGVEWMKNHPNDFAKATLINTSFAGMSPAFHRLHPSAVIHLAKVPFLKGRSKETHILKLVCNNKEVFDEAVEDWTKIDAERPVNFSNTVRQLIASALFKVEDYKPEIPVKILGATFDRMVSVECSRAIARKWKAPYLEHPSAGHDLTLDDPTWVAQNL
jgi:pimeloyl-ACP methyl ester carboxylesterase